MFATMSSEGYKKKEKQMAVALAERTTQVETQAERAPEKLSRRKRTRREGGFGRGFVHEGMKDSIVGVENIKKLAITGGMGAIGWRATALGPVGVGLHLAGGVIAGIYGGAMGYNRAKAAQPSYDEKRKELRGELQAAASQRRAARLALSQLDTILLETGENLDKTLSTIEPDPATNRNNAEEMLDYLQSELVQYQTIIDLATEAQDAQIEANKAIVVAETELRDALALPENGPETPAVRNPRTNVLVTAAVPGAPDPKLIAERTKAVDAARLKLSEALARRNEVGSTIRNTTLQEVERTIEEAIGRSNRLTASGVPAAVNAPPMSFSSYDPDTNPPTPRTRTQKLRDFKDIIGLAKSLKAKAEKNQTDIKDALKTLTDTRNGIHAAQMEVGNAEEAYRFAREKYGALVEFNTDRDGNIIDEENSVNAERRYERSQRRRRTGAFLGGMAVYLAAYFGGGAAANATVNAAFVGPNSGFNMFGDWFTYNVVEPTVNSAWWNWW
jgi:hypothetical protein